MDEIAAILARHRPGREAPSIVKLGEGWDNVVYEVDGELIVRQSKEVDPSARSEAVRREANLLEAVAGFSTVPVPIPLFVDPDAGVLAYARLTGRLLRDHPVTDSQALADSLADFIGVLHAMPSRRVEPLVPRETLQVAQWRADAERNYPDIAGSIGADDRRLIEDFLDRPPPAEGAVGVFCHNNLGAENLLVDEDVDRLSGVIDWTDAAITDPALDLAPVYRDLGPEIFELTLSGDRLGDVARSRAVFFARCALIEDIAYALAVQDTSAAERSIAALPRTFS